MASTMKSNKIKNFKVKYDGEVYDDISYFSISEYGDNVVTFTSSPNANKSTTINCKLDDIEIIRE